MKLSELLVEDLIVVPLEAEDKWQAIRRMAEAAAEAGRLPAARVDEVEAALVARERSMTTGMEKGIAIPHAAVEDLPDVVAVLGLSRDGIPFETLDGQPARIVVCLVIPRAKKLFHIKTLAEIARLLTRAEVRDRLLSCEGAADVLVAVRESEAA